MKLAIIVPGGVDRSGEYRVVPALLALLRRLAQVHEVHAFALAQETTAGRWKLDGTHIHNVGGGGPVRRIAGAMAAVLQENRIAHFDVVHAIWSGACGLAAIGSARLIGAPSIVHYAGGELEALPQIGYGGELTLKGRASERLVLRAATSVTAASAPMIAKIAARGRQAHLVPLGVDLEHWPPRQPLAREHGESLRLVHIASLNRVKDQPTLLHALAVLAEWGMAFHLDLIGEDTLGGRVQTMALALGLEDRIRFHGFKTQREMRPLLERAHLNVISSRHEAGPLAVLEAAVAGIPTCGTAVGHIAEWAPHAALAAPPGDAQALAEIIRRIAHDEALRLRLANEAQRRALAQDADSTCAGFTAIYEGLVSGKGHAVSHGD